MLTLLISFTVSLASAQNTQDNNNTNNIVNQEDTMYANTDTLYNQYQPPQVTYNYYYRIRFFDRMFRLWFPHRYNRLVFGPGHVQRPPIYHYPHLPGRGVGVHPRVVLFQNTPRSVVHHTGSSARRGGFGHFGSSHSINS